MIYRRQASPLHAARAAAGLLWCLALIAAALITASPWPLLALLAAVLCAGRLAHCGRVLLRTMRFALPMALTICAINALVSGNGFTVIWRFGNLPILGATDITLQAVVYGAVLGLKAALLILIASLYSSAVDPDELLRSMRRFSFRSALTATIATRMVPVLLRDGQRLAEAQRCRPGPAPSRLQLMRATTSGVLDRALDIAAALEVRGYGAERRPPRMAAGSSWGLGARAPWSRHDIGFMTSAVVLTAAVITDRIAGWTPFASLTVLQAPLSIAGLGLCGLLAAVTLVPFADRRGIAR